MTALSQASVPESLVVSGVLAPDATGIYSRAEDWNGKPSWALADSYFIWWSLSSLCYVLSEGKDFEDDGWLQTAPPSELGTYSPTGTYTGDANVTTP